MTKIRGLDSAIEFDGIDPKKWRSAKPDDDFDDDEDVPASPAVVAMLGLDPDDLFDEE